MNADTTARLSPEREAEIAARADAATPGPWGTHRDLTATYTVQARPRTTRNGMENDGDIATLAADRADAETYANARFVAHAREDVPALLAELAAVRAERDQARGRVAELERPAVQAKRNEIRQSYAELIAAAEETKDYEGAFDVQCRLLEREAQWKREDEEPVR